MRIPIRLSMLAVFSVAAAQAQAQTAVYEGTSMGTGSGKCSTYQMSVEVTVAGNEVKGLFQQAGRTQRHFEATRDASGKFKTEAVVGGGNKMAVSGTLRPDGGAVLLDGYCRFDTKLARRQQ